MGNASKRRYDGKHRVTRAFLADYIIIKKFAQRAGLSMAEALHRLIALQVPKAKPVAQPAFRVSARPAFRIRPQPTMVTNGHKAGTLVIKPKGGIIQ
ncbi:hypothetical protein ES708_20607 [subsurface metagenome]